MLRIRFTLIRIQSGSRSLGQNYHLVVIDSDSNSTRYYLLLLFPILIKCQMFTLDTLIFFSIASPSQKDPMDAKDFSQGPKILNYYQKIQEWMVECIII